MAARLSVGGSGAGVVDGVLRRALTAAAVSVLAASAGGCSHLFAGYDRAPNGLLRSDWELRRALVEGHPDTTLLRPDAQSDRLPDDALLRVLYQGVLAYYAGRPSVSSAWLDLAYELAEERYTKSLSRSALSLVSSDLALPYEPVEAERLLIHYFGALSWLEVAETDEAAVEARRLSFLLDRYDDDDPDGGGALRPFLRRFAGAVFEAAGEWNDADVAYRKAAAYAGLPADSAVRALPPADGHAEVVVLVERGFVAHQVEEGVIVALAGDQAERLTGGGADERAGLAAAIAIRTLLRFAADAPSSRYEAAGRTAFIDLSHERWDVDDPRCDEPGRGWPSTAPDSAARPAYVTPAARCDDPRSERREEKDEKEEDDDNPYLLRLAWPAFRQDRPGPTPLRVVADDAEGADFAVRVDLSDAVTDGFQERREWVLARMIVRASAKLALTRTVEEKVGEKDEAAGKILGFLTNAGTALLEQADTRSLHLLPAGVSMARLTLSEGTHVLRVEVTDGAGGTRQVELPAVKVNAGDIVFVTTRLWS